MKIVCDQCGSKYSVDDSKVQNKSFKITCKKCGNKIIIDNTKKEEIDPFESQTNWDDDAPMGSDLEFDDQATKIMSYKDAMNMSGGNSSSGEMDFDDEATQIMSSEQAASLNATAAREVSEEWYVHINGQQVGPLSLSELQNKIKNEKLSETTNVWKTGMDNWTMLKNIPSLASFVVKQEPADPFGGGIDSNTAAFGNNSLLDDSDAESLFNDKQEQSSFSSSNSDNPFGNGLSSELDLKSLINEDDIDEEEDDASSKSKVIDFRDIQGNNNKKIVVQHASFNAATTTSGGGNKGLIIGIVALVVLALGGAGFYFGFVKKGNGSEQSAALTKIFITSNPSGALIKFNGKLIGKTGGDLISVKSGIYKVEIIKDGYKTVNDTINVKKEDFIKKYTLEALPKSITVKTGIAGAVVTIGEQKITADPNGDAVLKIKPASNIAVKVEKDGAVKISTMINVSVDGDSSFNLAALAVENKPENIANTGNEEEKETKTTKRTSKRSVKRTSRKGTRHKTVAVKKAPKDDLDDLFNDTPKKVKKTPSNLPKTLKQAQVLSVIKRTYPKVKSCGKRAGVTGKVIVKFKINGSGAVSAIKVAPNAGSAKNCIYSKVRAMRFPKFSGAPIPVTFPFKL